MKRNRDPIQQGLKEMRFISNNNNRKKMVKEKKMEQKKKEKEKGVVFIV